MAQLVLHGEGVAGIATRLLDGEVVVESFESGQRTDSLLCGLPMMNRIHRDFLEVPSLDQRPGLNKRDSSTPLPDNRGNGMESHLK